MCGILGYYGIHSKSFSEKTSLSDIAHRGPDFSDETIGGDFYLGHTRLSILDLSTNGNQPMFSEDRQYVIIFNGEIYNHLELREEYLENISFKSKSDTETLLYGLIKKGMDFIDSLNGIFAFSFYNFKTKEFIIVRDQFGVKPLYYHLNNDEICFSSELKSFIKYISELTINTDTLKRYLNFLWSPGESTPVNEIKKLLPGHVISGYSNNLSKVKISKYYQISFDDSKIIKQSECYFVDELEKKLLRAVQRQLLSDVPVGFFLSGGLDSSLIVAMARKLMPSKKISCYTIESEIAEEDGFVDDLFYAKKVAKYLNVDLNIVKADMDILKHFDKTVYHLDEPLADVAPINVYNICKQAKEKGIKVLLGGVGGDDLFSGYRRHQALKMESLFQVLPLFLKKRLKKMVSRLDKSKPINRRLYKLLRNIDKSTPERLMGYFDWMDDEVLEDLFLERNTSDKYEFFKDLLASLDDSTSNLSKILFLEMNTFLVDLNLNYTDKLSMATGVEVRVPFLDKELVAFSTMIPPNLKLKGKQTKYILKKVAERYLPKDVIYRSKTGFGGPLRKWIKKDMSSVIDD